MASDERRDSLDRVRAIFAGWRTDHSPTDADIIRLAPPKSNLERGQAYVERELISDLDTDQGRVFTAGCQGGKVYIVSVNFDADEDRPSRKWKFPRCTCPMGKAHAGACKHVAALLIHIRTVAGRSRLMRPQNVPGSPAPGARANDPSGSAGPPSSVLDSSMPPSIASDYVPASIPAQPEGTRLGLTPSVRDPPLTIASSGKILGSSNIAESRPMKCGSSRDPTPPPASFVPESMPIPDDEDVPPKKKFRAPRVASQRRADASVAVSRVPSLSMGVSQSQLDPANGSASAPLSRIDGEKLRPAEPLVEPVPAAPVASGPKQAHEPLLPLKFTNGSLKHKPRPSLAPEPIRELDSSDNEDKHGSPAPSDGKAAHRRTLPRFITHPNVRKTRKPSKRQRPSEGPAASASSSGQGGKRSRVRGPTVVTLRKQLRELGLPTRGRKAELLQRLADYNEGGPGRGSQVSRRHKEKESGFSSESGPGSPGEMRGREEGKAVAVRDIACGDISGDISRERVDDPPPDHKAIQEPLVLDDPKPPKKKKKKTLKDLLAGVLEDWELEGNGNAPDGKEWTCTECEMVNLNREQKCYACHIPRPPQKGGAEPVNQAPGPRAWAPSSDDDDNAIRQVIGAARAPVDRAPTPQARAASRNSDKSEEFEDLETMLFGK